MIVVERAGSGFTKNIIWSDQTMHTQVCGKFGIKTCWNHYPTWN